MNRSTFLRALSVLPLAPPALRFSEKTAEPEIGYRYEAFPPREGMADVLKSCMEPQLGYRPQDAGLERLKDTGEARKYRIWAVDKHGREHETFTAVHIRRGPHGKLAASDRSQVAYVLVKNAVGLARTMK